jgi:hypothetical protein
VIDLPSIRRPRVTAIALAAVSFLTVSLVTACGDDDELSLDQAAEVDADAAAVTELHGAADVSFGGVTAAISGVTCSNDAHFVVSPIVSDTFTLTVDGDPTSGAWNIVVTEPSGMVWNALDPTVDLDGDALAGSAQMHRADDPTVTAALAFVVDC